VPIVHSNVSYKCIKCAECCGPWEIPVSKHECGQISGMLPGDNFSKKGKSSPLVLKKKSDGYCLFLDKNKLCKIHLEKGEKFKPLGCKLYPFELCRWDDGITSAYCRMDCPGTFFPSKSQKESKKIDISSFKDVISDIPTVTAKKYSRRIILDTVRIRAISKAYLGIIRSDKGDLATKLLGCAELLDFHSKPKNSEDLIGAGGQFADDAVELYERSLEYLQDKTSKASVLDIPSRIFLRQMIAGFARRDEEFAISSNPLKRIGRSISFGAFSMGLKDIGAIGNKFLSGPVESVREEEGCSSKAKSGFPRPLPPGIPELLLKYMESRLKTLHFMSKPCLDFTFEDGIRHLICASLSALWITRSAQVQDPMLPIRIVDHNFSASTLFSMPHMRLCRRNICNPGKLPAIISFLLENS